MTKIKAEIVADSINPQGDRITTYLLTFPRFVLAELNTHRVFSKNSASSRAIPFHKMVRMVETDPFIPIAWQKDHKGMQGTEYFTDESQIKSKINCWLNARDHTLRSAKYLNSDLVVHKIGDETFISFNQTDEDSIEQLMAEKRLENTKVTKQLCNRLLEPFMWHTVLLTGTEFENFFELRCPKYEYYDMLTGNQQFFKSKKDWLQYYNNKPLPKAKHISKIPENDVEWLQINHSQAEIHIQALAEDMWDAMNESTPKELKAGEWHIPFGDRMQDRDIMQHVKGSFNSRTEVEEATQKFKIKISTARCARLSYMTFDGKVDYEKDLKLHDTLLESHHMSPFEHCSRVMSEDEYYQSYKGNDLFSMPQYNKEDIIESYLIETSVDKEDESFGWCRNFKGFIQYRYLIEN